MSADQTTRVIHPDWPPLDVSEPARWQRGPAGDIATAIEQYGVRSATPIPLSARPFLVSDIFRIERQWVTYHGELYSKDGNGGSELEMACVGVLTDGRWFSVVAGNDYTGWGCLGDHGDIRVGASEEQVVRYGLGNYERALLGYPAVTA